MNTHQMMNELRKRFPKLLPTQIVSKQGDMAAAGKQFVRGELETMLTPTLALVEKWRKRGGGLRIKDSQPRVLSENERDSYFGQGIEHA